MIAKICVFGPENVGKSQLVLRYAVIIFKYIYFYMNKIRIMHLVLNISQLLELNLYKNKKII